MRTVWFGIIALSATLLSGCLETVPASYGPASLAYELPSETLGGGEHGMPGQTAHVTDGRFTGWSPGDQSWTKEWSDATALEIARTENEPIWVLFDHQPEKNTEQLLVVVPWAAESLTPGCGLLLRGASETDVDTWTLWAGQGKLHPTHMVLNNNSVGKGLAAFSWNETPLATAQGTRSLIAEFSIPLLSGVRKWTVLVPEDEACTHYVYGAGVETVVSGDEGYHTIRPMSDGSVSFYEPVWDTASDTLTLWGQNLDALTLGPGDTLEAVVWGDLARISPFPSVGTGLTNQNLSGREESLPLYLDAEGPKELIVQAFNENVPLGLDGVNDPVEYDNVPQYHAGDFHIRSKSNGGEQQSWVTHSECKNLAAQEVISLSGAFGSWHAPSSIGENEQEQGIASGDDLSSLEMRSWAGAIGAGRAWAVSCQDTEEWLRLEHANHQAGAWLAATSTGAYATAANLSWDKSLLVIQGRGLGKEAGTVYLLEGEANDKVELSTLEWSQEEVSVIIPAEQTTDGGTFLINLDGGDSLYVRP